MIVVVAFLAFVVIAQAGCLIVSNRHLQSSNTELIRAVIAKDGRELAAMNRVERRPAADATQPEPPLTREALYARISSDIDKVEGVRVTQPVGLDGT